MGRFVVFGHAWFFGSGLRVRSCSCGFCGSVVLPSMPTVARPIVLMWFLRLGGLARIDARPLALCGPLKRFAHRPDL